LGLGAFYLALIWINTLLGVFLTPLFIVPLTWLQDAVMDKRRRQRSGDGRVDGARPVVVETRPAGPRAR
jgi:hypothetical protein